MGPMIDDDIMPVFIINGFLEAGKTSFLSFTMDQEYFRTEGKTLLIVCEEGDTEYDEKLLKDTKTAVVYMDDLSQMTPERLTELELLYNPERVLIEWNGMWNQDDLIAERDKYSANDVLPGLTGWAQINGRDELPISEKARLDGEYVKRMSFLFDVKCFFGTLLPVLRRDGVREGRAK